MEIMGNTLSDNRTCPNCGSALAPGALLCVKCGRSLIGEPVKRKSSGLSVRSAMFILLASVVFMLLSCGGAWWIVNSRKRTSSNIKDSYTVESKLDTSIKIKNSKSTKPGFISRMKELVSSTVNSGFRGSNSSKQDANTVVTVDDKESYNTPGKTGIRPVEWDIKFTYKHSIKNPDQRYVECKGWISFEPGVFPKVKLYSSPEKNGNYSLCGEAVLAKSNNLLESIKRTERFVDKVKNPEQKRRMLESLRRRKEIYERYKNPQKRNAGKTYPLEHKALSFMIKDKKSLKYNKNNVWYKLKVLSSRDNAMRVYPPVKIQLFYKYYKREEQKYAYSVAFPGQDKIDVTLTYFTMKKQNCYHLLYKLTDAYEYKKNKKTKYGPVGFVFELYTHGHPGWRKRAGRNPYSCSFPTEDIILELGADENSSFLQLLYKKYELIKLTNNGKKLYPYKLKKSALYRKDKNGHNGASSKLEYKRMYLATGKNHDNLFKVTLQNAVSKQVQTIEMPVFPEPPPVRVENKTHGVVISWGNLNYLLPPSLWLKNPRLVLIRETRIKSRKTKTAIYECGLIAGAYTDTLPEELKEKSYYYIELQDGVLKNWMYDASLRRVDYYTFVESFRVKKNVRQVPKGNKTVTRKLRIAVNVPELYHDNTGPIGAKLESALYGKILSSGTMVMFDRLHSKAIDQEKTMAQSLKKVKANFSLKKIPADYAFQIRDRSTSIGDFVELWLIRIKGRLDGVVWDRDNKEYEPYNNVWRIGQVMLNEPDLDHKISDIVSNAVGKVEELSPDVSPKKDKVTTATKFVWDGLEGVNQDQPVYGEKLEGLSESLMLASADALKNGNILSRDDWLLIRQERDFSKMGGESLNSGAEGQILISGRVVNYGKELEYYLMATDVFTCEVVGVLSCKGSILETGRKIGDWCGTLSLSPHRKSLYDNNIESKLIYKERVAVNLVCQRFGYVHRLSRENKNSYLNTARNNPVDYAHKQWKIGNRKYAIELLERNIKTIRTEGVQRLADYYHSVGLFDKEKALLERYVEEWAVKRLARMSQYKPRKKLYKYIDSLPEKRYNLIRVSKRSKSPSSDRWVNKNYEYEYSCLRPGVLENWNKDERFFTYSSTFTSKNKSLLEMINSPSVTSCGVIKSAKTKSDSILKKKSSSVKIIRWSAIDLFDKEPFLNISQRSAVRAFLNRNYDKCISSVFSFHPPVFIFLNKMNQNINMKVSHFDITRDGSGVYYSYIPYGQNVPVAQTVSIKKLMNEAVDMIVTEARNGFKKRLPDILDICLCELMAKNGNLKAKFFMDKIRDLKIPHISELRKTGEELDRYSIIVRLRDKGISRGMLIYRASMGDINSFNLIKSYPKELLKPAGRAPDDTWYFVAKRFPVKFIVGLLGSKKRLWDIASGHDFRLLKYAGRRKLDDILSWNEYDVCARFSKTSLDDIYYYLALGVNSNKVKKLLIEKYRTSDLSRDGLTALVQMTGHPLMELDRNE